MPGRFFLTEPLEAIAAHFEATPPEGYEHSARRNIAPGQEVLAVTEAGVLRPMRWGIIPVGRVNARGRPVMETIINARSETVFAKSAFEGVGRAIVPMNGWYEWTGERRRKTAWRIARPGRALMGFAAIYDIWRAPGGREVFQVATVTCAPSRDVRDIHHRMGVILPPEAYSVWLQGDDVAAAALMQPYPDGTLAVDEAGDVDWDRP